MCIAAVRGFLVDRYVVHRHVMCIVIRTYLDTSFFPVGGIDRYVVHRHVMCVVIRAYLDTRFFPVGGKKGGTRRHAGASDEACTGIHVTQVLLHTDARHRMRQNISWVCATRHVRAYWNGRGSSVWFVIPIWYVS